MKWSERVGKLDKCERGIEKWKSCPCKGKRFGLNRYDKRLEDLGLMTLPANDPHFYSLKVRAGLQEKYLKLYVTEEVVNLIICQDCGDRMTCCRDHWFCHACFGRIIPHENLQKALEEAVPDFIAEQWDVSEILYYLVGQKDDFLMAIVYG